MLPKMAATTTATARHGLAILCSLLLLMASGVPVICSSTETPNDVVDDDDATACRISGDADEAKDDGTCSSAAAAAAAKEQQQPPVVRPGNDQCSLYLAKSTIPNAGLGPFTAVPLAAGDTVGEPELSIPIFDAEWHRRGGRGPYIISEYTWQGGDLEMDHEALEVDAMVMGIGAAINCHAGLINVEETTGGYDLAGVMRTDHPTSGSFTAYFGRSAYTLKPVPAGGELFVAYGDHWFIGREEWLGMIPLLNNYRAADRFLTKYRRLLGGKHKEQLTNESLRNDLWDLVTGLPYDTKTGNALKQIQTASDADNAAKVGAAASLLPTSVRSIDWLERNGKCMTNLKPGLSTIPHAGRGAFATRNLLQGALVGFAPLLHVPDADVLNMYAEAEEHDGRDPDVLVGKQVLVNYCFGHAQSTMLLCPYGAQVSFINHPPNGTEANVRVVWAEDISFHNADWLNKTVDYLASKDNPSLAFDYVALRDIQEGEEIFMDYGDAWQTAWDEHVQNWIPYEGPEYIRASEFDENVDAPLLTEDEGGYPDNVMVSCRYRYRKPAEPTVDVAAGEDEWEGGSITTLWSEQKVGDIWWPCTILERDVVSTDGEETFSYTARILTEEEVFGYDEGLFDRPGVPDGEEHILVDMPREGASFVERPYSSDLFLSNAFRHEIMVPDSIFPKSWMNK